MRKQNNWLWSIPLLALIVIGVGLWWNSTQKKSGSLQGVRYDDRRALRVVSLVPSLTRSLYEMGAGKLLVGRTSYCVIPKGDSIPIVSSAIKPNIESIVALHPDLVLTSSLIESDAMQTLQKLGIRVASYPTPKSYTELRQQFLDLGTLLQVKEKAQNVVDSVEVILNSIRTRSQNAPALNVVMQFSSSPIYVVPGGTFMSDLIQMSGCNNSFGDLTSGQVSTEAVVARNPDVIFIVSSDSLNTTMAQAWQHFDQLKAVQQKQLLGLEANKACQPTPINFLQTLQRMEYLLESIRSSSSR